jgi:hypothetical protein
MGLSAELLIALPDGQQMKLHDFPVIAERREAFQNQGVVTGDDMVRAIGQSSGIR